MGLLHRFRKKKKTDVESIRPMTELEQLCGEDKETYEALVNIMFLNPKKIGVSMKEAGENAIKFEKAKDFTKARLWYEIAGGLAIYEGNVKKVVEYFSKCEEFSPDKKYAILKNPEKAIAKAREYYQKYLQANS